MKDTISIAHAESAPETLEFSFCSAFATSRDSTAALTDSGRSCVERPAIFTTGEDKHALEQSANTRAGKLSKRGLLMRCATPTMIYKWLTGMRFSVETAARMRKAHQQRGRYPLWCFAPL